MANVRYDAAAEPSPTRWTPTLRPRAAMHCRSALSLPGSTRMDTCRYREPPVDSAARRWAGPHPRETGLARRHPRGLSNRQWRDRGRGCRCQVLRGSFQQPAKGAAALPARLPFAPGAGAHLGLHLPQRCHHRRPGFQRARPRRPTKTNVRRTSVKLAATSPSPASTWDPANNAKPTPSG